MGFKLEISCFKWNFALQCFCASKSPLNVSTSLELSSHCPASNTVDWLAAEMGVQKVTVDVPFPQTDTESLLPLVSEALATRKGSSTPPPLVHRPLPGWKRSLHLFPARRHFFFQFYFLFYFTRRPVFSGEGLPW